MTKQIVIAEQQRIAAVFSEDQIQELIVATGTHQVSDIYLGIVENVLPGIDAAFVNIGDAERNGFIHVTDLGPLRLKKMAGSITELLAPQQKVLVQVMKEPTGNKGPRLTGNVSLPGRYLVLMPYGRGVNLSRRIRSENERNRLRALAILTKPAGMGLVVRTEAENIPEEAIIEDLEMLQKQWESVLQEASTTRAPALLNRDDDFVQRVLRDVYSNDVNRIVVDSATGLKRVKQNLTSWAGGKLPVNVMVDQHRERVPMLEYFRVNAAIREAMKPRVDLPSGGYIVIEKTEALTVIDVNSGSFTRSATARETVLWTNCESATEIARQLRLRNIAGVIIVDFIDMDSRRDQLQVLEHFNKALREDKSKPQIAQLTELGLVELTRKRQGKNIYELFGQPCQACSQSGLIVHLPGETHEPYEAPGRASESRSDYRGGESRRRDAGRDGGRDPGRDSGRDVGREPVPVFDGFPGEEPDLDNGNESDLELLHHPSYRERNRGGSSSSSSTAVNGNNRRRRRRGEGFPSREEGASEDDNREERDSSREPRSREPRSREPRESLGREPRESREPREGRDRSNRFGNGIPASTATSVAKPAVTLDAVPDTFMGGIGSSLSSDQFDGPVAPLREERDRRGRSRRERLPAEPPEFVHVEMNPDEQDVYAWMGVSPLVLIDKEVKNPKNTVIAVTLPGEPVPEGMMAALVATPVDRDVEDLFDEPLQSEPEPERQRESRESREPREPRESRGLREPREPEVVAETPRHSLTPRRRSARPDVQMSTVATPAETVQLPGMGVISDAPASLSASLSASFSLPAVTTPIPKVAVVESPESTANAAAAAAVEEEDARRRRRRRSSAPG